MYKVSNSVQQKKVSLVFIGLRQVSGSTYVVHMQLPLHELSELFYPH